ncbi:hypothetical protein L3Q82_013691 [Scortum barcoo]|uniref:Uncharacterized protein n=1 Tax=Scortum barcoo TaxID=214431 RepID=A0ACB8W1G0_9TELE|nr:hypothetical protein L3Q82_013691 [Scortum barcoo]
MSFLRRVAGRSLRDRGGVPGVSHREEASGKTQDTLERLCLSTAGLGTPRDPPGRAGGSVSGVREKSGHLCSDCCLHDPVPVPDQADENGWMAFFGEDKYLSECIVQLAFNTIVPSKFITKLRDLGGPECTPFRLTRVFASATTKDLLTSWYLSAASGEPKASFSLMAFSTVVSTGWFTDCCHDTQNLLAATPGSSFHNKGFQHGPVRINITTRIQCTRMRSFNSLP